MSDIYAENHQKDPPEHPVLTGAEHLHNVLVDVIEMLESRADGFEARGDAIYNGALIAEELRRHAGRARGLL